MRKYFNERFEQLKATDLLFEALNAEPVSKEEFEYAVFIEHDTTAIKRVSRQGHPDNIEAFIDYITKHNLQSFDELHDHVNANFSGEPQVIIGKDVAFDFDPETGRYKLYLHGRYDEQKIKADKIRETLPPTKELSELNVFLNAGLGLSLLNPGAINYSPEVKLLDALCKIRRAGNPIIYAIYYNMLDKMTEQALLESDIDAQQSQLQQYDECIKSNEQLLAVMKGEIELSTYGEDLHKKLNSFDKQSIQRHYLKLHQKITRALFTIKQHNEAMYLKCAKQLTNGANDVLEFWPASENLKLNQMSTVLELLKTLVVYRQKYNEVNAQAKVDTIDYLTKPLMQLNKDPEELLEEFAASYKTCWRELQRGRKNYGLFKSTSGKALTKEIERLISQAPAPLAIVAKM